MRVHLRRRVTKLSGQILAAQRVAAAPGNSFVAAPFRCPASPASLLRALAPTALATRPTRLLPRAARAALPLLFVFTALAAETALDRYVNQPDASYRYQIVNTAHRDGYTTYVVD